MKVRILVFNDRGEELPLDAGNKEVIDFAKQCHGRELSEEQFRSLMKQYITKLSRTG